MSDELSPMYQFFMNRHRKKKFDEYEGKWYKIIWTTEALGKRNLRQKELCKEEYRQNHPKKEKKESVTLSHYQRKKMGDEFKPRGRPKKFT